MKSMTGYGKAEYKENGITISVEVRTVNNRFLDLNAKYPRSFIALDDLIRKTVQKSVKRGKLDLFINYKNEAESETQLEVDLALAKSYYNASQLLSEEFLELKNDFTLNTLLKSPDVVKQTQSEVNLEEISCILEKVITEALISLNEMREFEGQKLKADMLERISVVESLVSKIATRAPLIKQEYAKKLSDRVSEILSNVQVDETRLLQEVAIFADKSNIDEELTRLNSHVSQFRKICEDGNEAGKRLDFLIQEFNREANTVCSKSNDIIVTDTALLLKCEIEKLREQIQNVE